MGMTYHVCVGYSINFDCGLDRVQSNVKGNLKTLASLAKLFIDTNIYINNASTETPNFTVFTS